MRQETRYEKASLPRPDLDAAPAEYRGRIADLFDTWKAVRDRNLQLSTYYDMKNEMKDLGISIPPQLVKTNAVVGWAKKAVDVMAVRSNFDGFVFGGSQDEQLDALVRANRLRSKYAVAARQSLKHGLSFMTVMRGGIGQPAVKVRSFSANQGAVLWDRDEERVSCGAVIGDVDGSGRATRYVLHFPDAVLVYRYVEDGKRGMWLCEREANPMGRPLMEPIIFGADDDHPLGRSRITPEIVGIIDKAMRDVLRMEVGAEFFTAPQRYILGADEDLFFKDQGTSEDSDDDDGAEKTPISPWKAYLGQFLAITRDENGEIPSVGQFSPGSADNFIRVFENDAQRFSGATNVPLGQLGVLSNAYTSSDALGAANDPLILEVERMNAANKEAMEEIGRMMLAVSRNCRMDELPESAAAVQAYFRDPSMPTISARADAWTKLASQDQGIVGTRVYYEGIGLSQPTIDRLMEEKRSVTATESLGILAQIVQGAGKEA